MRQISHPALIKGVFRELAALRRAVHVSGKSNSGPARISIQDDFSRSALDSFHIRIVEMTPLDLEIKLQFELDGVLYSCSLKANAAPDHLTYALPSTLEPDQRRRASRSDLQTLGKDPLLVEVRGRAYRHYGYLKDSNQQFLTAKLSIHGTLPQIEDLVTVRAYTKDSQVLTSAARIRAVRASQAQDAVEVLLESNQSTVKSHVIRPDRTLIEPLTHLEIAWPDENGLRIRLQVIETGPTGFSARVVGNQPELPPTGAICKIEGSSLAAQVQWISFDRLGFDLSINDRSGLALWTTWMDEWRLKVLTRTPISRQQSRIASVLIRSGYLRDFKASVFSSTPHLVSLIPNNHLTRSWLCRFLRGSETEIDAHVSFARCSDSSWIIQELGNCAVENRVGESLLNESMQAFQTQELPYLNFGTTLIALFDPLSKFNQRFWFSKAAHVGLSSHHCALIGLSQIQEKVRIHRNEAVSMNQPSVQTWPSEWKSLCEWIDDRTLYGLGLRGDDFNSPSLRQDLAKSGYRLDRHTLLISKDGETIGVAVVMGVPTFSNLNATSNHLWIYLKNALSWPEVYAAILDSDTNPAFKGITESVLMIKDANAFEIVQPFLETAVRARHLFLIPTHSMAEFLKKSESKLSESA